MNIHKILRLSLIALSSTLLPPQTALASSSYTGTSNLSITINSITNTSTPGVAYGNDILFSGSQNIDPYSGSEIIGAGSVVPTFSPTTLPSTPTSLPEDFSFNQSSSFIGNVSNGEIFSYYAGTSLLSLKNASTATYIINYTANYNLSVTTTGESSEATLSLEGENFGFPGDEYEGGYIDVGTHSESGVFDYNDIVTLNLTLKSQQIADFSADLVFDSLASATPSAIPLPGAAWLFIAGLLALPKFKKAT